MSRPTLLVFTLGPARERRRRRLLPDELIAWEEALHRECLTTAIEAGRDAGCDVLVAAPPATLLPKGVRHLTQSGSSFGERLSRAIAEASGPAPLLVVGSDVPGLTAGALRAALAALADDPRRVVLGPSPDGGLYLLAAARPLPDPTAVPWQRRDTLRRLVALLQANHREVFLLAPLVDLDRRADLERLLADAPALPQPMWVLLHRLRAALVRLTRPLLPSILGRPTLAPVPVRAGRAPPL